jgi:hypothetical protein
MFVTATHFRIGLIFAGKAGAYQSGALKGLNPYGWLSDSPLPPIIRLGLKSLTSANALASYDMAKIMAIGRFIVQAPGACITKLFTSIYN